MTTLLKTQLIRIPEKKSPGDYNANQEVEIRGQTEPYKMRVWEVTEYQEREQLRNASAQAYPPYNDYQAKTSRKIPVCITEPI